MCELVLFGAGIVIMGLLLWVVILDGQLEDYKHICGTTYEDYKKQGRK